MCQLVQDTEDLDRHGVYGLEEGRQLTDEKVVRILQIERHHEELESQSPLRDCSVGSCGQRGFL